MFNNYCIPLEDSVAIHKSSELCFRKVCPNYSPNSKLFNVVPSLSM